MSWYQWQQDDLILRLRIQPKASRDRFIGPYGDNQYKVSITAPPVDGQANDRLLKFIAKTFDLPRSRIELLSGESSRSKCLKLKSPGCLPIEIEK
ncbi:MAG: DUF167 family protein [Candidatus Thiodiazotropha lotti]|uniref:UPF0235 protein A3196_01120 n=1 Tax=Candidatus Thiodiazotropha endoloripes TaxID=1818881 RepID=A0A1E2ULM1_9GAMM|nr:DUF167 family protein [Candidatus Thiodiazotropha endoloripes]MCG7899372.1 DUF167 family protein [Candidatus Thiodiazotropha weberae]MCG7987396.1 DUF167 family protein [Candidatus Thiodiazotropha lotti]MCG7904448.1 DUF167 family protein [Candidatus Thiodiazotropha weberae]MCG7915896.1 DUF167 family protein [Candidatus Thiodiazotropha weberae]MCG7992060.1 DUF167 family protein [Candidatus Thiodiazotropha lotti]